MVMMDLNFLTQDSAEPELMIFSNISLKISGSIDHRMTFSQGYLEKEVVAVVLEDSEDSVDLVVLADLVTLFFQVDLVDFLHSVLLLLDPRICLGSQFRQ